MFSYYYNDKLDQKIKNDDELASMNRIITAVLKGIFFLIHVV